MNISKEAWKELLTVLKKHKISYTAHCENRDIQKAMEYPDITVVDKHIQPDSLKTAIEEAFADVYTIPDLAKLYADIQVECQTQLEHMACQIRNEMAGDG